MSEGNRTPARGGHHRTPNPLELNYTEQVHAGGGNPPSTSRRGRGTPSVRGHRRPASSVASSRASVRKKEAEVEAKRKIVEFKRKVREKQKIIRDCLNEDDCLGKRVEELKASDHEGNMDMIRTLVNRKMDLLNIQMKAQSELQDLQDGEEDEMDLINQEKDLAFEKIDDEEEQIGNYDSGDDQPADVPVDNREEAGNSAKTEEWVSSHMGPGYQQPPGFNPYGAPQFYPPYPPPLFCQPTPSGPGFSFTAPPDQFFAQPTTQETTGQQNPDQGQPPPAQSQPSRDQADNSQPTQPQHGAAEQGKGAQPDPSSSGAHPQGQAFASSGRPPMNPPAAPYYSASPWFTMCPPPMPQNNPVTIEEIVTAMQGLSMPRQPTFVDRELPAFGGKPEEWLAFKAQFDRTTTDYRLSNSENLLRLRKALKGSAFEAVQFFFSSPDNVAEIMKTLEFEFGRKDIIIKCLIRNAESAPKPDLNKPDTVIVFARAVQSLVATIKTHQQQGYLDSSYLLDKLTERLPQTMQRSWQQFLLQNPSKGETLETFQDFMMIEKSMACKLVQLPSSKQDDKSEQKRKRGPGLVNTTTSDSKEKKCIFCDKIGHQLDKCWKFEKCELDDRWIFVKKNKVCVSCLSSEHRSRDCKKKRKCEVEDCTYNHHLLLHSSGQQTTPRPPATTPPSSPTATVHAGATETSAQGAQTFVKGCDGPLPIVPIKIQGPKGVVKTYGLLDTGASTSLIRKSLADELGLEGEFIGQYNYQGAGGEVTELEARRVECNVQGMIRGSQYGVVGGAVAVTELPIYQYSIDVEGMKKRWPHLKNVQAKSLNNVVPDIVIGNNNPHLILPRKLIMGKDTEPWGWRTPLGWTISGNFYGKQGSVNMLRGNSFITNDYLHQLVKSSFSFDDMGVKVTTAKGSNQDERRALAILESTTKKIGDGWECGLLWREDNVVFPESEPDALHRLEMIERKMKNPVYAAGYKNKIQELLDKNYARKLTPAEAAVRKPSTYVLPTFGVLNPNKPGKFRLVWDAKAKVGGVSLNDKLLKGPDLIRPLTAVLINWRRYPVAITGDITDMFLRVRVREEDQDSQRFLWRDGDNRRKPDHYCMQVLMFGATSSPASAIYVKNKNASLFENVYPRAAKAIVREFYVDDAILGGNSEQEVIELRQQISEVCQSGNFTVCKWLSNSTAVQQSIPPELQASGAKGLVDKEDFEGERVLGLWWDPAQDNFQLKLGLHKVKQSVLDGEIPTKREMCSLIMSLFDPLGFIAHYKVKGQILLQQVWSSGIGWDDEIPMEVFSKWKTWISRLPELSRINLKRCYFSDVTTLTSVELHTFVDASSEAYSAVCYLLIRYEDHCETAFLCSKARVAPLKKSTIPRLELQAAVMGARLATTVCEELEVKIDKTYYWSDSSTVLQWLRSPSAKLKEFVANRIGEIQEVTDVSNWRWVPTKLNIADIATRFESDISFDPDSEWFTGPAFLKAPSDNWNFKKRRDEEEEEAGVVHVVVYRPKAIPTAVVAEPTRFSSFIRLVRATAAVHKAALFWLGKTKQSPWSGHGKNNRVSRITAEDFERAQIMLWKRAQEEDFAEEIDILKKGLHVTKKSKLWRLSPCVNKDGLICVDGRIRKAEGALEQTKYPIILPARHPITDLLVDYEHANNAHQAPKTIIANLRKGFWVIDAGHSVKRSFSRCWSCKLKRVKPMFPRMADLPEVRLAHHQPAFTNVGIDLFGPLFVTVGRRHEKRWGVVICCLTTRAIFLDVVYDLSSDELIMCLSRFIDTRIRPHLIMCDNGTNLVGASRILKEAWGSVDWKAIQSYGRFQQITWRFIPPGAPHMGGAWEALVKLSKKCLSTILHDKFPKDTVLITSLKSIENMLNSRPLTDISTDPNDPEVLTPNHFLRGECDVGPALPNGDEGAGVVKEKWRKAQQLKELFWRRWMAEYLPKLVRREKWYEDSKPLDIGAIVLIMDENSPMNCWRKGYVSKLYPSQDGQVRAVEVTSRDFTTKKETITKRPVVKICPIGLSLEISQLPAV